MYLLDLFAARCSGCLCHRVPGSFSHHPFNIYPDTEACSLSGFCHFLPRRLRSEPTHDSNLRSSSVFLSVSLCSVRCDLTWAMYPVRLHLSLDDLLQLWLLTLEKHECFILSTCVCAFRVRKENSLHWGGFGPLVLPFPLSRQDKSHQMLALHQIFCLFHPSFEYFLIH